jgi:hypothetical protein
MPVTDYVRIGDRKVECGMSGLTSLRSRGQIGTRNQIKARLAISLAVSHMQIIADLPAPYDRAETSHEAGRNAELAERH